MGQGGMEGRRAHPSSRIEAMAVRRNAGGVWRVPTARRTASMAASDSSQRSAAPDEPSVMGATAPTTPVVWTGPSGSSRATTTCSWPRRTESLQAMPLFVAMARSASQAWSRRPRDFSQAWNTGRRPVESA